MININFSRFSSGLWIAASAVAILTFFYLFYAEIYIKNKEEAVISTRFRVLDQMGKNIGKRYDILRQNAEDLSDKVTLASAKNQELAERINSRKDINKNLKVTSVTTITDPNNYTPRKSNAKRISFEIEFVNPKDDDKNGIMTVESSYENLITGLERDDIFNGILLINNKNQVVHNTLNQEIIITKGNGSEGSITASDAASSGETEDQQVQDFMKSEIGKIFSGEAIDMKISNSAYKAFIKPIEVNSETWYIIGVMHKSAFNGTIRSIEPWFVILLSIVLIFIILGMPMIKLVVISKTEQLDTSTIISSGLSTIIGGSVIILFLFFISQNYKRDEIIKRQLTALSDTIVHEFLSEINNAYKQMVAYENNPFIDKNYSSFNDNYKVNQSLLENTKGLQNLAVVQSNTLINLYNEGSLELTPGSGLVARNIFKYPEPFFPSKYPYGDYYFWVDNNGRQKAYFTPFNEFGNMSNLSSRDYVNKKDEWFLPGSNNKKFRLESIVSVSSGSVKAAISKPSELKGIPVTAISTQLTSIINTILPKDYAFCIIDKSGKVWFHSNENLNLKENFIDECSKDSELKALIYAGAANTLEVDYYNQRHKIHITPINNIPLYLVTMHNMRAESSFQAQVITITLALFGFLLLILFIQIVALLIIERKYRLALNRNFILKLARPISRLNSEYSYLVKLYIIVVLVMIPFLVIYQELSAIATIFAMVVIMFGYSFHILNQNELKAKHRKSFGLFNLVLLILINVLTIFLLKNDTWWEVLIFEVVLASAIGLAHYFLRKEKQDLTGYWKNYGFLFLMVLILFGIFPMLKFYELAYKAESEIRVRHLMYDFANQKEKRNLIIHNYFDKVNTSDDNTSKIEAIYNARMNSGIYGEMVHGLKFCNKDIINTDTSKHIKSGEWDKMIKFFRPYYDDYVVENKYLLLDNAKKINLSWQHAEKDNGLTLVYPSLTNKINLDEIEFSAVTAEMPQLSLYLPFNYGEMPGSQKWFLNILFWIVAAFLIYLIYILTNYSISQIFTRRIITNFHYQDFGKELHQQKLANKDIMVYRLSRRDHSTAFRDDFIKTYGSLAIDTSSAEKMAKTQRHIDSLIRKKKASTQPGPQSPITLLIDHFDSNFEHAAFFAQKLELVSKYLKRHDIHLVIFSQLKPDAIKQYYNVEITRSIEEKIGDEEALRQQVEAYKNIVARLDELMIALLVTALPVLYHRPEKSIKKYCTEKPRRINDEELIRGELSAGDYLLHYQDALITYKSGYIDAEKIKDAEELIINKINTLADKYYNDLYENCNAGEKYALFDMAHDQIVNPKNEAAINGLLKKGLLVKKCYKINFMNMSFRRFISAKLNKAEKLKIEAAMGKPSGTWQGYRNTLMLVIVALFVFIGLANQDFLDNLNNLFVALGGVIAVVTGVLGLLSQKRKPETD